MTRCAGGEWIHTFIKVTRHGSDVSATRSASTRSWNSPSRLRSESESVAALELHSCKACRRRSRSQELARSESSRAWRARALHARGSQRESCASAAAPRSRARAPSSSARLASSPLSFVARESLDTTHSLSALRANKQRRWCAARLSRRIFTDTRLYKALQSSHTTEGSSTEGRETQRRCHRHWEAASRRS